MHTIKARGRTRDRVATAFDATLADRLEWISTTAAAHRASLARLAGAQTEKERREAAYEEALTKEMHRTAVSHLGR